VNVALHDKLMYHNINHTFVTVKVDTIGSTGLGQLFIKWLFLRDILIKRRKVKRKMDKYLA
jgi:hypothetical protein